MISRCDLGGFICVHACTLFVCRFFAEFEFERRRCFRHAFVARSSLHDKRLHRLADDAA